MMWPPKVSLETPGLNQMAKLKPFDRKWGSLVHPSLSSKGQCSWKSIISVIGENFSWLAAVSIGLFLPYVWVTVFCVNFTIGMI